MKTIYSKSGNDYFSWTTTEGERHRKSQVKSVQRTADSVVITQANGNITEISKNNIRVSYHLREQP